VRKKRSDSWICSARVEAATGGPREKDTVRKRDLERFRKLLIEQRDRLLANAQRALGGDMNLDPDDFPDEIDTASSEVGLAFIGRLRERERGLMNKILAALEKIDTGVYGECESCGEEIGMKRLEARPVAELCIDCKAQQEKLERGMG
jgi:DnaK suppressor protein